MIRSGDEFDKGLIGAVKIIAINPFVIVGITFFGLSLLAYCATLPRLSLSIAYPILTTGGFAIITLVSMLFFQEHLSLMQIIGLVFLALGIWFTSMF
jgi:multidrug transporter EmrE-like cation transporter